MSIYCSCKNNMMHSPYPRPPHDSCNLLLGIRLLLKIVLHTTLQRLANIMLILILLLGLPIARQASHSTTSGTFNPRNSLSVSLQQPPPSNPYRREKATKTRCFRLEATNRSVIPEPRSDNWPRASISLPAWFCLIPSCFRPSRPSALPIISLPAPIVWSHEP